MPQGILPHIVGDPQLPSPEDPPRREAGRFAWLFGGARHRDDPNSPEGFRRRLHRLERAVQYLCHLAEQLRLEAEELRNRLETLRQQYARFWSHAGRNLSTAVIIGLIFILSWWLDFVFLSPLVEFFLGWVGLGSDAVISGLLRALGSSIWVMIGYAIGSYAGLIQEQRWNLGGVWRFLWWVLVLAYVSAMPALAWATSSISQDLRLLHCVGLTFMAVVSSTVPIVLGAVSSDAKDYLLFLWNRWRLQRRERSIRRQWIQAGFRAIRQFGRLLREAEEFRRRFGESFTPQLDEVSRRVIDEFGNGRIRIDWTPESPRPNPVHRQPEVRPDSGHQPTNGAEDGDWQRAYNADLQEQEARSQDSVLGPDGDNSFTIHLP